MTKKIGRIVFISLTVTLFAALIAIELFHNKLFDSEYADIIYPMTTRFIGGFACTLFVFTCSFRSMLVPKTTLKAFVTVLPCMLIAVNNFPFITFFGGDAYITDEIKKVILYALLCLSVGFFEEMAFRGCIFSVILSRRKKNTLDVFISIVLSSVVFGVVHIVNLFAGASPGAVFLQIGYSFLIGGMCSVVLLKTANIWYCVILHAVYNFAGGVVPECGGGIIWNAPTIVLTAVVAVPVAAYVVYQMIKITPREIEGLLNCSKSSARNNDDIESRAE